MKRARVIPHVKDLRRNRRNARKRGERITSKKISRLKDLQPDGANANRHTERGSGMMEQSIRNYGFGDSLTVDRNGVVISGNQRLETLADIRMDDPIVVRSDGSRPIIHQRTDLEASDPRAKSLAIAQNRVGEINLDWDAGILRSLGEEVDLGKFWTDAELAVLLATPPDDFPEVGEGIEIDYVCPKCGYRFSGGQTGIKGTDGKA